ncbi:hypothetical protein BDU57DRAFT_195797 [Ampelomyces quisqualis]|uniref:Uncharacterized protein n=1 Tax=Ampelomyces quisqualis TaxID=50730 RepID=A0A6A5QU65_AMPQU|nr:hypothetical protein BDU57DRAFT_195797 [Ampelomyces quisqualis]
MESDSKPAGAPATAEMLINFKTAPELSSTSKVYEAKTSSKIAGFSVSQQIQDRQHSKAKQALPHIAVLLKGIIFLTLIFAVFGIGFRLLSLQLESDLQRAEFAFRGHSNVRYREQLLYNRLDEITSTPLSARFMEKHSDCLVRGVNHVNQQLFGVGLQYPDIRNQTIDWTTENCGRLHHTLQRVLPSVQQDNLTYWTRVFHQGRYLSAKAGEVVLAILRPLESFLSSYQAQMRKSMPSLSLRIPRRIGANNKTISIRPALERATMPIGFALDCGESLCRVVFTEPPVEWASYNKTSTPAETITKTERKLCTLIKVNVAVDKLKTFAFFGFKLLVALLFSCAGWYAGITIYSESLESFCTTLKTCFRYLQNFPVGFVCRFTILERIIIVSGFVAFTCVALSPSALPSEPLSSSEGDFRIAVDAVLLILLPLPFAIQPCASKKDASIVAMCKALIALCRIIISPDAPSVEARVLTSQEEDQVDEHAATERAFLHALTGKELESRNSSSVGGQDQKLNQLPTYPYRKFYIDEDLENEDQTYGCDYDTEFETESESDDDEMVDLAGGITPTMVEDSDWSVVDA